MTFKLVEHHFALPGQPPPPVDESLMYDYVFATDYVFARGRRPGIEVCMPVAANLAPMRSRGTVFPYLQWGFPRVPARMLSAVIAISRAVCKPEAKEALFYFSFNPERAPDDPRSRVLNSAEGWHLEFPDQRAAAESVEPAETGTGSAKSRAVIELHSHHSMPADFSAQDDEDEGQLFFRVYAVVGTIFERPSIRVRVGLFGHFFEFPAAEVFDLPWGLADCLPA